MKHLPGEAIGLGTFSSSNSCQSHQGGGLKPDLWGPSQSLGVRSGVGYGDLDYFMASQIDDNNATDWSGDPAVRTSGLGEFLCH